MKMSDHVGVESTFELPAFMKGEFFFIYNSRNPVYVHELELELENDTRPKTFWNCIISRSINWTELNCLISDG